VQDDSSRSTEFRNVCRRNGFDISDAQFAQLEEYVSLLLEWNQKINLISRRDEDNVWTRHILASIAFLFFFEVNSSSSIVDVGTGGGLPGIPLAILLPRVRVSLVDSILKKINALDDIVSRLHLLNVQQVHGRAEVLSSSPLYQHTFDYVVSRAVAPIQDLVSWSRPFLQQRTKESPPLREHRRHYINPGAMLLLKGGNLEDEIDRATSKLKLSTIQSYPIIIDGIDPTELHDKKLVIVRP
jgi:16S rRNA (guanine527-N7)-methyltransferase